VRTGQTRRTTVAITGSLVACLLTTGCGQVERFTPPPTSMHSPAEPLINIPTIAPACTIEITTAGAKPPHFLLGWSVQVPTGGFSLTTDRVELIDTHGKPTARVFVTLEAPGPNEMTTQMIETLTGEHSTGDQSVVAAELHLATIPRGERNPVRPQHRLVAAAPAQLVKPQPSSP